VLSAASSPCLDLNLIHYKNHLSAVIPTDVKACLFESRIILHRHSRAGGNPRDVESKETVLSTQSCKNLLEMTVIPAQAGIQTCSVSVFSDRFPVRFRSFTINSYCFSFPDSHFRGNDGGEDKFSQSKTSSFP
ncbi:hypothetical protein, partial [Neisseria meningitidis]|uniref:hypothetical protein n=1 Tax=Neisseria meningitidis TaxID=487 RepID=UPI001C8F9E21